MDANRWERLESLFVAALERDAPTRDAFLRGATADDPTLYAEVSAMLAATGESRALAVESVLLRDTPWGRSPGVAGVSVPASLGAYRLIEQIGRGGMGVVYRAERADGQYTRTVAIKLVRTDFASPDLPQRTRAERQILARLEHANIARLLDGGVTDDGSPYLVMEHVSGRPITEHCDAVCMGIEERLRLFQVVCRAVHYAHQNLVVHRDLKPSNILVTAGGDVKLLDFGIAKLLDPGDLDHGATTRTAMLMTPDYASPEQVRGEPVTTATDVYALGLLLHELLSGARAQRTSGASPSAIERTVCEHEPAPPSVSIGTGTPEEVAFRVRARGATRPESLRRTLHGDLDTIVAMALRKEPARRYASAEQLAGDIDRYVGGLPVHAGQDTLRYRAGKFVRRNRPLMIAAAAVLVSLLTGAGLAVAGMMRARDAERRAIAEAAAATHVSEFLVDLFRANDPSEARGEALTARQLLDRGAARVGGQLDDQPHVRARLLGTMAQAYQSLGLFAPAVELRERELAIYRERAGDSSIQVGTTLGALSDLYGRRSEYDRARRTAREAVAILERTPAESGRAMMRVLNQLGMAAGRLGELDEARAALERSLAIGERVGGPNDPALTAALNNLAIVHWQQGDPSAAHPLYERALSILEREFGTDHPTVAHTLNNLGLVQSQAGKLDDAVVTHRRALAIREKVLDSLHPDIGETLNNLGVVMLNRKDFARATPLFERALTIREQRLGPNHSHVASTVNNLGTALLELGELDAAARHFQRALASLSQSVGPDHMMTSYPLFGLARIDRARGALASAEVGIRRVIAIREREGGPSHPELSAALHELAEVLRARGRRVEADSLQRRADVIRTAARDG
jgi:eukaryotic-like serine/threonine-protein kinase